MNTTPRFCTQCGQPLTAGAQFCAHCGKAIRQAAPALSPTQPPAPPPPAPQPMSPGYGGNHAPTEPIVHIIPGLERKKGFLGLGIDNYCLVITPNRLIFAYLDSRRMQDFVNQARNQAKAQGKGFFGQIGAQLGWLRLLEQELANTPPDHILAQDPHNFQIPNQAISKIRLRQSYDSENQNQESIRIVILTTAGKHQFHLPTSMNLSKRELKQRLQQTLGGLVR
jgi:hypothetical protein